MSWAAPLCKHKMQVTPFFLAIRRRWVLRNWRAASPTYYHGAMAAGPPSSNPTGESSDRLATALQTLRPIEEKVVRLSYGIGCQRAHSATEIAAEFAVAVELVESILEDAEQRLAGQGVPRAQLREAGRPLCSSRHRCRAR